MYGNNKYLNIKVMSNNRLIPITATPIHAITVYI